MTIKRNEIILQIVSVYITNCKCILLTYCLKLMYTDVEGLLL